MKGFKETDYIVEQKARLDFAVDQITNINSSLSNNSTGKSKLAAKKKKTDDLLNELAAFDDSVRDKVRQMTSSLAVNVKEMTKFIKERFKIQT